MHEGAKARLALAAVCFFWGTTYFAIRIAVRDLPPALFCAVRFSLAGAALLLYALRRGQALPRGKDWARLGVVGLLLLGVGNGTLAWAEQWVPTGIASLIIVTTPFWLVAFARLEGERVRPRALTGLLVGFLGLSALLWPDLSRGGRKMDFQWAALGLLCSSAVWSYGSIYSKRKPVRAATWMAVAFQKLVGGAFLGAVGLLRGEWAWWHPSPASLLALAYLIVFGSIIGYGSYIYALARLPTAQVAIYAYVNPIVAVLLGVLFLGERFDAYMAMGIPMVLGGIYLVHSSAASSILAPAKSEPVP